MAHVLLDHVRHGHAQTGRKILDCHSPLFGGVSQQLDEAAGQAFSIASRKELDGEFLALSHLLKIGQIRANDGNAISASQMRDTATSG